MARPVRESSCRVQLLESPPVVLPLVQWRMVVGKVVPVAVQVVRHDVDEVQVVGNLGDCVAFVDSELGGRYGSREQPALVHDLKSLFQFGHKTRKVVLVRPLAVPVVVICIFWTLKFTKLMVHFVNYSRLCNPNPNPQRPSTGKRMGTFRRHHYLEGWFEHEPTNQRHGMIRT